MRGACLVLVLWAVPAGCDGDGRPAADAAAPDDAAASDAAPDASTADGGADPDAGTPNDPLDPLVAVDGFVRLVEGDWGATADVRFMTAAWPTDQELVAQSGPCALYRARTPGFCDPPCDDYDICSPSGDCLPSPERISAGAVQIAAPDWTASATPDDTLWYEVRGAPSDDLFAPGDSIAVTAEGADVAAFAVELEGVGDARPVDGEVVLTDGRDAVIDLEPQDDGALVELVLQTGWHGAPAEGILWCTASGQATEVTIAASLVDQFPPAGGIGLFPHPSYLRRVQRRLLDDPSGTIEVSLASEASLVVTH